MKMLAWLRTIAVITAEKRRLLSAGFNVGSKSVIMSMRAAVDQMRTAKVSFRNTRVGGALMNKP